MAIHPPSDIVLDVARAADPARLRAAALKLTEGTGGADAGFTDLVDGFGASGLAPADGGSTGPAASWLAPRDVRTEGGDPKMKPYRDFEAFVLQSFIQDMLPKDANHVYGQGVAGEMWRNMLAQQLGKEIARGGGIGIAKAIYKAHPEAKRAAGRSHSDWRHEALGPIDRSAVARLSAPGAS